MKKRLFFIIRYLCTMLIITQCGYQLSTNLVHNQINIDDHTPRKALLYSYDPYNTIIRMITNELLLNNICIVNNLYYIQQKPQAPCFIPSINIINVSKHHIVVSVCPDGTPSEYQIVLKVQVQFSISTKDISHPFNINVYRTFIHNTRSALSDLIQNDEILNEMYQDIAQKLVQQFLIQLNS